MTRFFSASILYRIVSGLGLAMLFAAHDLQDVVLPNILLVLVGIWAITSPWPRIPMLFVLLECVVQFVAHHSAHQSFRMTPRFTPFDPTSLMISGGLLLFLAGQYRLVSIRSHVAPYDPRFASPRTRPGPAGTPMTRPDSNASAEELVRLLTQVAIGVVAGGLAWEYLSGSWEMLDFAPRFSRLAAIIWLGIGVPLVLGGLASLWHIRHASPATARLFLQETAWTEARREYARIGRWIAWGKRRHGSPTR